MKRMQDVLKLMAREMGETNLDSLKLEMDDTYSVGIDLEEGIRRTYDWYRSQWTK